MVGSGRLCVWGRGWGGTCAVTERRWLSSRVLEDVEEPSRRDKREEASVHGGQCSVCLEGWRGSGGWCLLGEGECEVWKGRQNRTSKMVLVPLQADHLSQCVLCGPTVCRWPKGSLRKSKDRWS